jgi:hypothetical protein
MSLGKLIELHQFIWMFETHRQQRLTWRDAAEARVSRTRAESRAAAQAKAMLDANPSGQLGNARLNDPRSLKESGLL